MGLFTATFMKLTFQDGRPFMFSSRVFPYVCELEFGNPSVVVLNCVAFIFSNGLNLYEKLKNQDEDLSDKQKIGAAIGIVGSLVAIIVASLQGIYNGTNTIDQVLFGVELGLFIAFFCHYLVKDTLRRHITNVLDGMYVNRYKQLVMGFLVAFLSLFFTVMMLYALSLSKFKAPNSWLYQISVKCPVTSQLSELIFHDAVFAEYGMIFFLAGAYLGIVIDAKNYKGSIEGVNNTNLRKTLTRIVLSALPAIPIYVCPLYLIAPRRYVFIIFTLKYALPSFLITFLLFGHSKMIY